MRVLHEIAKLLFERTPKAIKMLQGQMDSVSLLQGVLTKFVMMFIPMKMDVFCEVI